MGRLSVDAQAAHGFHAAKGRSSFDLDLDGLVLLGFGQRDRQDAVLADGLNPALIDVRRERDLAAERAVGAFDVIETVALVLFGLLLLAADGQAKPF